MFLESARIARGKIDSLSKLDPSEHEAVIFPGGFGAAKNLYVYFQFLVSHFKVFHLVSSSTLSNDSF